MAEELCPNSVFLRMPVTSIAQSQGGHCTVYTDGGMSFQCRRVIVSIPTSLYHQILFKPALPKGKATLSDNTATGYYTKVIYVFKEPWWQTAGLSGVLDSDKGPIIFTRDTSIPVDDQWSITCFLVGDKGRNWSKLPGPSASSRPGSSLVEVLANLSMCLHQPIRWRWIGLRKLFSSVLLVRSQLRGFLRR